MVTLATASTGVDAVFLVFTGATEEDALGLLLTEATEEDAIGLLFTDATEEDAFLAVGEQVMDVTNWRREATRPPGHSDNASWTCCDCCKAVDNFYAMKWIEWVTLNSMILLLGYHNTLQLKFNGYNLKSML